MILSSRLNHFVLVVEVEVEGVPKAAAEKKGGRLVVAGRKEDLEILALVLELEVVFKEVVIAVELRNRYRNIRG